MKNQLVRFAVSLALALSSLSSEPVFASGGSGAGVRGGGVAVWIDGRWKVKDVFQAGRRAGAPMALSPKLRDAIQDDVRPLVELYTGSARAEYWDLVLDDAAEYRLVDVLPCPRTGERLGSDERNFGCTMDGVTYFDREVFADFDNGTRLLAILHERGHALDPRDEAHDWIVPFVDGVRVLLAVAAEQERGEWRRLDADEVKILDRLAGDAEIAKWLGRGSPDGGNGLPKVRTVVAQGGGILLADAKIRRTEVTITDDSYVGVGAALDLSTSTCGTSAAEVEGAPWVFHGSRIVNSLVQCHVLLASVVEHSQLRYREIPLARPREGAAIGGLNGSTISGSKLLVTAPLFATTSRLEDVDLEYRGARKATIEGARLAKVYFRTPDELSVGQSRLDYALEWKGKDLVYDEITRVEASRLLVPVGQ